MILKARFNSTRSSIESVVQDYIKTNNNQAQLIVTDAIVFGKTVVIGSDNEVMFLIGFIAGLGIHTLENVQEVI